jgi:hypothetical protein
VPVKEATIFRLQATELEARSIAKRRTVINGDIFDVKTPPSESVKA